MENFVVSARKYRPKGFEEVIGQDHITTTLKNAINENHLAQALLFCGPRGVGKTTCARIVARMINNFDEDEQDISYNIFELDAASNNKVENIRDLIEQVRYPPQFGKYKIYIIDEVHMLTTQAFNAFLKTLEEPPPYAIFILATTEKHKVIPTILSRCQIYDFNRIPISEISNHLSIIAGKERITVEHEALHLIAQKADGALRDALSMFDLIVTFSHDRSITYASTLENLHVLDYDYYFKLTDYLLNEDIASSLVLFDEILKIGFDGHDFISGLELHFRNLMVCQDIATLQLLDESENVKTKYQKQSENASMSFLLTAMNIGSQCDMQYKSSKNQRLLVELTLMKMAHISSVVEISASPELEYSSLENAKKKTELTGHSSEQKKPGKSSDEKDSKPEKIPENASPAIEEEKKETNEELIESEKQETTLVEEEIVGYQNLKKTTRIPSLTELAKNADRESNPPYNPEKIEDNNTKTGKIRKSKVSSNNLDIVWEKFKKSRKEKAQELNVLSQPYQLSEDQKTIKITLTNSIQLDILSEIKSDLMVFLKNELDNDAIQIEGIVQKDENKEMLYTNKEKFEHLAEKYPIVKELQKTFKLDPEF